MIWKRPQSSRVESLSSWLTLSCGVPTLGRPGVAVDMPRGRLREWRLRGIFALLLGANILIPMRNCKKGKNEQDKSGTRQQHLVAEGNDKVDRKYIFSLYPVLC